MNVIFIKKILFVSYMTECQFNFGYILTTPDYKRNVCKSE